MFWKTSAVKRPHIIKRILSKSNKPFSILGLLEPKRSGFLHLNCNQIVLLYNFSTTMNYQITIDWNNLFMRTLYSLVYSLDCTLVTIVFNIHMIPGKFLVPSGSKRKFQK